MLVGITYDLKDDYIAQGYSAEETAEFDSIDTIESIESALNRLGFKTERIGNFKKLLKKLVNNEKWDIVFNIAEGFYGISRESQVPSILEAYNIPYTFSDPSILAITLHKGMTKRILRQSGIATADFAEVKLLSDIDNIKLPFPLFVKPVAEGTGKGIDSHSIVNSYNELRNVCDNLLNKYNQTILIEVFLPGKELTVGIVGSGEESKVLGIMEVIYKNQDTNIYSYKTKKNYEDLVHYSLISEELKKVCEIMALKAWKILNCRDAGRLDIRLDSDGKPNFLEVNPLAGLNPIHSDLPILCKLTKVSYIELIRLIMLSALKRYQNMIVPEACQNFVNN